MKSETKRVFFRAFATMLTAGVPLHEALTYLCRGDESSELGSVAQSLSTTILSGNRLSTAMRALGHEFPAFHCALVRVGEETGALPLVLERLADYEENSLALQQLLVSRLTYPAVLLVFALAMLVLLPAFCLEGLFQVLENSDVELPLLTTIFITTSRGLRHPLTLIAGGLIVFFLFRTSRAAWKNKANRDRVYEFLFSLPALGPALRQSSLARFTDALALQLSVGITPLQALPASASLTSDPELERDVQQSVVDLKNGASLGESFETAGSLSPMLRSMITVGEESGKLPVLLRRTSRFYSQQVEHSLDLLAGLLEPLIMVIMGILFGLMLIALMTPLVALIETL